MKHAPAIARVAMTAGLGIQSTLWLGCGFSAVTLLFLQALHGLQNHLRGSHQLEDRLLDGLPQQMLPEQLVVGAVQLGRLQFIREQAFEMDWAVDCAHALICAPHVCRRAIAICCWIPVS